MAAVLLALAVWLLRGEPGRRRAPKGHLVRRELTDRSGKTFEYDVPIRRGVAYSVVVGFVSSFLGIGDGVMQVPLLGTVAPTGRPVEIRTIDVLTIADGVITALWVVSDELGTLTQLDAVGLV
jgi:uncharacterized membrane protein YfcA